MKHFETLRRTVCRNLRAFQQSDAAQVRAFHSAVRLFAAILVLTLVARAASVAALPTVTITKAAAGTLVHTMETAGTVLAVDGAPFKVPAGLLVQQLYAKVGETVQQGAPLVRFDADSVAQALAKTKARRDQLSQQIELLRKGQTADAYSVKQAQALLDEAYAACAQTQRSGEASVAQAAADCDAAQKTLDAVLLLDPPNPEQEQAARDALQQAQTALSKAQSDADAANTAALQTAQSAERARTDALYRYEQAAATATDQTAQSRAEADVLAVELSEQQTLLQTLTDLTQTNYTVFAPQTGTLTQLLLASGAVSSNVGGSIARAEDGYTLSFLCNKEQAKYATVGMEIQVEQNTAVAQGTVTVLSTPDTDGSVTAFAALPAGTWRRGAAAVTAELLRERHDLTLPPTAVQQDLNGYFVYTIEKQNTVLGEQDVLVRTPVSVLANTPERVAITGAVLPSMQIVETATKPLQPSARVRVAT